MCTMIAPASAELRLEHVEVGPGESRGRSAVARRDGREDALMRAVVRRISVVAPQTQHPHHGISAPRLESVEQLEQHGAVRCDGDAAVERGVRLDVLIEVGAVPLALAQGLSEVLEIRRRAPLRRERGGLDFDRRACFDDGHDVGTCEDRVPGVGDLGGDDEYAGPLPCHEYASAREDADGLPHGRSPDAELRGERGLAGELLADPPLALPKTREEEFGGLLGEGFSAHGRHGFILPLQALLYLSEEL